MNSAATWPAPAPPQPPQHHHPSYNPYAAPPPQPHHRSLIHHPQPQQTPAYSSSGSYYPNPNPHHPDPYAPHGGYSVGPAATAACAGAGGGLAAYYYERIAADPHGFAVKEEIRHYGTDPAGFAPVPPRPYNGLAHAAPPPHVIPPQLRANPNNERGTKKGPKSQPKSAYCAVCKIDCNRQEVLDIHKHGKKHKKNLQKLQELITPKPQRAQVTAKLAVKKEAPVPVSSDKGKAASSQKAKRKEAPEEEDLETKKRKILEEGAEPNQVKVCTICNVVVNSQKVYDSHLAGSKHAAMVKKQQGAAAT